MTGVNNLPLGVDYDPESHTLDQYIDILYQYFLSDLVFEPLPWKNQGLRVSLRKNPQINGRHAVFWHIVSGGEGSEEERNIERNRCVRICWIRIFVELFNKDFPGENKIRWWIDRKRVNRGRYVITRPEFDYVVVIEERSDFALLVTAYYVEHERRRKKLREEHESFWQEPLTE